MWLQDFIKPKNKSTENWHEEEIQQLLGRYNNGEKNANMCQMLILFYAHRGDEENAKRFGDELLEHVEKDEVHARDYLCEYYHSMARLDVFYQRWEAAIANYKKVLEYQEVMESYYEMAGCYTYIKDMENAEKYGLMALEVYRNDREGETCEIWEDIGRLLAVNKKYKEAIEIFSEYVQDHPDNWYSLYCIGECWQGLGDQYRALAFYQKVLAIKPNSPHVYNNLGALAINDDARIQEGIDYLKQALEHVGNERELKTTILINLSRAYATLTDYEQSEHYKVLMLQNLGFPVELVTVDEDEDDYEEDIDEDDIGEEPEPM